MKKFIILALLLSVSLSIGATEYVMIGPKAFEDTCQVLLTLRTSQGFTSSYLAVEDIWANPAYNGVDEQEEIRNAILDYYTNNSTKYVVIVGDTNLVPVRHLIVAEDINFKPGSDSAVAYASAPADLYYSCLNGSFNFDGDTRWGEMDDGPGCGLVDLTLHVAVGRIAAGNLKELRNHIFKIISYELAPDQTDVLMIGEEHSYAYESWDTWNGDLLDAAFNATLGPNGYTATTLYDRDNTNTDVAILNEINTGNHEILLNGQHASPYGLLKMDYNNV